MVRGGGADGRQEGSTTQGQTISQVAEHLRGRHGVKSAFWLAAQTPHREEDAGQADRIAGRQPKPSTGNKKQRQQHMATSGQVGRQARHTGSDQPIRLGGHMRRQAAGGQARPGSMLRERICQLPRSATLPACLHASVPSPAIRACSHFAPADPPQRCALPTSCSCPSISTGRQPT